MEYKDRAKTRKYKRQLIQIVDLIKLKWLHLSTSKKIILFWLLVGFISLFLNWTSSENTSNVVKSFSELVWRTWITLIIIQSLILFLLFSRKNKEKFKLSTDLHIKDFSLVILWWVLTIIVSINALNFINWLKQFSSVSSEVFIWMWIISEICAWIIITVWWILLRSEFYKNRNQVYLNESEEENPNKKDWEEDEDSNMSLPF